MERRILLEAERQATHSKGIGGDSSGHAKSTGKVFQRIMEETEGTIIRIQQVKIK